MATKDRIYIDKEFIGLADRLVRRAIPGSESSEGVFQDTRELAVFAAGLGYRHKQRFAVREAAREIKLSAIERIPLGGTDIVEALSVAHAENVSVLAPDKALERATIFEEFMNGGLERIAAAIGDEPALRAIVKIVRSEHAPDDACDEMVDLLSQRL